MVVKPRAPARARKRRERPAQRRRTRKAIVDAAAALLAQGRTPSVDEVAAAAEVSRRTVYLYFPTFEQLLLDATVGALSQSSVDQAIAPAAGDEPVEARVERMVRALHNLPPDVERLGRQLVRLTVDRDRSRGQEMPPRGYRRMAWIEAAIAPWRDRIGAARQRRLACALAMIVGWEALIVQRDVCGASASEGEALALWAARAFLDATLREVRARPRRVYSGHRHGGSS